MFFQEHNVIVDLETMGNRPTSAIVAIGAVHVKVKSSERVAVETVYSTGGTSWHYVTCPFQPAKAEIVSTFYEEISLASAIGCGLTTDASTISWWLEQSEEARKCLKGTAVLGQTLQWFRHWFPTGAALWGCGAGFDNVILGNAFDAVKLARPWGFRDDRCFRTLREMFPEIEVSYIGTYHNALDDAINEANHFIEIVKRHGA